MGGEEERRVRNIGREGGRWGGAWAIHEAIYSMPPSTDPGFRIMCGYPFVDKLDRLDRLDTQKDIPTSLRVPHLLPD